MAHGKLFISHNSALEFWRTHDLDPSGGIRRTRKTSVRDGTANLDDIKPLARQASPTAGRIMGARREDSLSTCVSDLKIEDLPLHVMVGDPSRRRITAEVTSHLYEKPLPEGSLCQIDERVYVASPELTLCQLATSLSFVEVLELCLEFCGTYALNHESERGFDDRSPLTSATRLASFVKRLAGRRGAKQMRPVLNYVIDNSASPMESIVLMLLCLPSRLGGYQLPLPEHNITVPVKSRSKLNTSRQHLSCDLYWDDYRLDVECDSTAYHTSKQQLGLDSERRIILDAMGRSHVSITRWQLEHKAEFEDVVRAIRRIMGLGFRAVPEHIEANREALRTYLIAPHDERGTLRLVRKRKSRPRTRVRSQRGTGA